MKSLIVVALTFGVLGATAYAEQTESEKADAQKNELKRDVKKKWHHAEEAACSKGDAACLEQKAKHRAQEGDQYMKDKVQEHTN